MIRLIFWITILSCITVFNTTRVNGQETLLPIDSLFISTVDSFYKNAEYTKGEIWKGMKLAPVCLFRINGPALLYMHPNPPKGFTKIADELYIGLQKDYQLYGATQVEINGVLTAIVDYSQPYYSSIGAAYAELFHELHHVYQRTFIKQIKIDNPATLLKYPENYINDAIKLFEQRTLYKMCFESNSERFQSLLNQFYSCRLKRKQIIGNYLEYEETVENMEGPAFYCEYKFYNQYGYLERVLKQNYNHKHFWGVLTTPFYGRDNLRQRHLASGMAMCFILDKHFNDWKYEFDNQEKSLYSFFISKFNTNIEQLDIDSVLFKFCQFHTKEIILMHQLSLNRFMSQQGVKITLEFKEIPRFEGFDPMNAEAINDSTILHSTMLKLSNSANNKLFVHNCNIVSVIDKEIWFTQKVILFVPNKLVEIVDNRINISCDGINITWQGVMKIRNDDEIIFSCN